MEPPTPFRFADLPTELALLVFVFAAQPTFTETDTYDARNPYSPALLLCSVSKIVRRTVLPLILHTVLLSESRHVMAFVDALHMQKAYAEQQHHLCLDYASSVHRIWMGEFLGPPRVPNAPFISNFTPYGSEPELDVSLLAPVLLAAPSLALDFASLDVLLCCIKYTLDSDVDLKVDHERSPSPWSTKNLTLSGCVSRRWRPFTETVHGYAFLSSISHLTSLSHASTEKFRHSRGLCASGIGSQDYTVPLWMMGAPFKRLQTFSLAIPHIELLDIEVDLFTFPASLLPDPWTPHEIRTYIETGGGLIPSDEVPLPVSCARKSCALCVDWEKVWACGCEGRGVLE